MKAILAIFTVLGLAGLTLANNPRTDDVTANSGVQDLKEIKKLIPVKEMINLAHEYYKRDKEFKNAVESQVEKLTNQIKSSPEFKEAVDHLKQKGLNAREVVVSQLRSSRPMKITGGGFEGFIKDMEALIPNEIKNLNEKKLV